MKIYLYKEGVDEEMAEGGDLIFRMAEGGDWALPYHA